MIEKMTVPTDLDDPQGIGTTFVEHMHHIDQLITKTRSQKSGEVPSNLSDIGIISRRALLGVGLGTLATALLAPWDFAVAQTAPESQPTSEQLRKALTEVWGKIAKDVGDAIRTKNVPLRIQAQEIIRKVSPNSTPRDKLALFGDLTKNHAARLQIFADPMAKVAALDTQLREKYKIPGIVGGEPNTLYALTHGMRDKILEAQIVELNLIKQEDTDFATAAGIKKP